MISGRFDLRQIEGYSGKFLSELSFHFILWIANAGFTYIRPGRVIYLESFSCLADQSANPL